MARKQPEKRKVDQSANAKLKPVRVDLTEEDHQKVRIAASFEGKSMAAALRDLAVAWAEDSLRKRGVKL